MAAHDPNGRRAWARTANAARRRALVADILAATEQQRARDYSPRPAGSSFLARAWRALIDKRCICEFCEAHEHFQHETAERVRAELPTLSDIRAGRGT